MLPLEIQAQIREMIKNAVLEYLMKRYIRSLVECRGGLPMIGEAPDVPGKAIVRIVAIKKKGD